MKIADSEAPPPRAVQSPCPPAHARPAVVTPLMRQPLIDNVMSVIDGWANSGRRGDGALRDAIKAMLQALDWDLVGVGAIKSAFTVLLSHSRDSELIDISAEADAERRILDEVLEKDELEGEHTDLATRGDALQAAHDELAARVSVIETQRDGTIADLGQRLADRDRQLAEAREIIAAIRKLVVSW